MLNYKKILTSIAAIASLHIATLGRAENNCKDLLTSTALIYPYPLAKNASLHLKFGFESEYTIDRYARKLLKLYAPDSSLGLSKEAWLELNESDESSERIEWIKENLSQVFAEKKQNGKIEKLTNLKKHQFLPSHLIIDYTGNLEIVVDPVDSFEIWLHNLKTVEQDIGPGSMQATVGIPKSSLFAGEPKQIHAEISGLLQLLADMDALEKLEIGYSKYQKNLNAAAARAFAHPYLGPLTASKRQLLDDMLAENILGRGFTKENRHRIGMMDDSFKYIGSTTYRPDLGGKDYVVFEVRDAHSNFELLTEKLQRMVTLLTHSRQHFSKATSLQAFDSELTYESLSKELQQCLESLFPPKYIDPKVEYTEAEVLANQVYRNFAFPLRNWSSHIKLSQHKIGKSVLKARTQYLNTLSLTCQGYAKNELSSIEASIAIQGALAGFAYESGLRKALHEQFFANRTDPITASQ